MDDGGKIQPVIECGTAGADTWSRTDGGVSRTITIEPSWLSWGKIHTGHVAALGLQTMSAAVGAPWAPRTLSTALFRPIAEETPLTLTATVERVGSSSSVATLRAVQAEVSVLVSTATFGTSSTAPPNVSPPMPAVPLPASSPTLPHALVPFSQHLEIRAATGDRCLGGGSRAEITSWIRFSDGRAIDAPGLAVLLDGYAPSHYATLTLPVPMPLRHYVVEFGDDLTSSPSTPWVLVSVRMAHASGGWVVDEAVSWSEDGRFLASARQYREILTRGPETEAQTRQP